LLPLARDLLAIGVGDLEEDAANVAAVVRGRHVDRDVLRVRRTGSAEDLRFERLPVRAHGVRGAGLARPRALTVDRRDGADRDGRVLTVRGRERRLRLAVADRETVREASPVSAVDPVLVPHLVLTHA